jgi:CRISPR/Cas system-associated exonuclease Cas4 (RecB family)
MSNRFQSNKPNDESGGSLGRPTGDNFGFEGDLDLSTENYGMESSADVLEHVSKSRIKTFLKCERKFAMKYLAGVRSPQNYHMEKGTNIHDTFEAFHKNVKSFVVANQTFPENFTTLMPDSDLWYQFLGQMGAFFQWELDRWDEARSNADSVQDALDLWTPVALEKSITLDDPPVGELPWLGPTDLVVHAASVPSVDDTDGLVIVDYKTGSVSDPKYRGKGIHIDLAFYCWVWEQSGYDVRAGVGLYPQENEKVVRSNPDMDARQKIVSVVDQFSEKAVQRTEYDVEPQPLCSWCYYQDQCPTSQDKSVKEWREQYD